MKIFLINLRTNVDRLVYMDNLLKELGFEYERFEAVDGRTLTPQELRKLYVSWHAQLALSRQLVPGEIGCALSHLGIYRRMVEANTEFALILEDDVWLDYCTEDSLRIISKKIDPGRPQVFFLSDQGGGRDVGCWRISSAKCADAYVISLPAAKAIIDGNYPVVTVADKWQRWSRRYGIELYAVVPAAARQLNDRFATNIDDWENPSRLGGGMRTGWRLWLFKMRRCVDLLADELVYRLTGK